LVGKTKNAVKAYLLSAAAVVVAKINEIQFRVGKIDSLGGNIQSQTIGPVDFGVNNCAPVAAVHSNSLNPGIFTPVGPEKPPGAWTRIQSKSSWLSDVC